MQWAIERIELGNATDQDKLKTSVWFIHHKKYNKNNKLDFNYVSLKSNLGSFEVIREVVDGEYTEPFISKIDG